ncbi:hypothetical protein B0H67DRAFT_643250 [Lasiosphaeris hirsuta]|uniref:CN hydrolase domain-containing protein n=1 Tax=Lasiosphaeris hirsuta TaxID=260670 RepID=A0AA40AQ61_9PEZI|nr:hypothetical protein B0H67DRAFT_643250 [Lasiosphaeris hirsuta]
MKIACLQFAPQVGDVDNNLNRADAVLNRAKAEDLEGLDLLVLPELAFSGYNYSSLQHISAYLEPPGSGISSLWARTTALKHDCVVIVGYPEKVDITAKWPASPEYYNSALIVNGDGETIGNYRKSFLYHTDETWALEGREGFFEGNLPRLGNVALGICMDINPYKFESKWDTFEFGFHILEVQANVVILTMAWHTNQDISIFSRRPQEPDLETLVYWVQRLEPLIKAESEQEVIVIFCNRSGIEDDVMYTGTSAVLGVRGGEVFVYGLLGRGVKELLVVDTSSPPISKLTSADGVEAENSYVEETAADVGAHEQSSFSHKPQTSTTELLIDLGEPEDEGGLGIFSPVSPTSPMWPSAAPQMEEVIISPRSPIRLQIPVRSFSNGQTSIDGAIMQDTVLESLDGTNLPSPIQTRALPKLVIPSSPWRFHKKASPHPWHQPSGSQSHVLNGRVAMTPITAFDTDSAPQSAMMSPGAGAHQSFFWRQPRATTSAVAAPTRVREVVQESKRVPSRSVERRYRAVYSPDSPKALIFEKDIPDAKDTKYVKGEESGQPRQKGESRETDAEAEHETEHETEAEDEQEGEGKRNQDEDEDEDEDTKASRTADWGDLAIVLEGLRAVEERRPGSAFSDVPRSYSPAQSPCPDRPCSPKSLNVSRNTSRSQLLHLTDPVSREREASISRGSIPIVASPSIFDNPDYYFQSIPIAASPSVFRRDPYDLSPVGTARPSSRMGHRLGGKPPSAIRRSSLVGSDGRSKSLPGVQEAQHKLRSSSMAGYPDQNDGRRPRSLLRHSISNTDGAESEIEDYEDTATSKRPGHNRRASSTDPRPRNVSRGRQPGARGTSVERSNSVGETRTQVSRRRSVQKRTPSMQQPKYEISLPYDISAGGQEIRNVRLDSQDSDDEIIANITRIAPSCPHHGVNSPRPGIHNREHDHIHTDNEIIHRGPAKGQGGERRERVAQPGSGKGNRYDISLLPFTNPPLIRALNANGNSVVNGSGDLLSASSSVEADNSPGPLTPKFEMTTPEPMILVPRSSVMGSISPEIKSSMMDAFGAQALKSRDDLMGAPQIGPNITW